MIVLVAAMGRNRVIGKAGGLPWHLPADLARFRRLTTGKVVLMGRKTFEAIGRPLPHRVNVILTRRRDWRPEGGTVVHSLAEALARFGGEDLYVIGGAAVFRQFLPLADRMHLTHIEAEVDGDTWFPPFDEAEWAVVAKEKGPKDAQNPYDYWFVEYRRRR
ncbi:MAG TPA: dihydrofolate reductase [Calditerricola sp.]